MFPNSRAIKNLSENFYNVIDQTYDRPYLEIVREKITQNNI